MNKRVLFPPLLTARHCSSAAAAPNIPHSAKKVCFLSLPLSFSVGSLLFTFVWFSTVEPLLIWIIGKVIDRSHNWPSYSWRSLCEYCGWSNFLVLHLHLWIILLLASHLNFALIRCVFFFEIIVSISGGEGILSLLLLIMETRQCHCATRLLSLEAFIYWSRPTLGYHLSEKLI